MKKSVQQLTAVLFLLALCACANEESEPQWLQNSPETGQQGASADSVPSQLPDYGSNHSGDHGGGHR